MQILYLGQLLCVAIIALDAKTELVYIGHFGRGQPDFVSVGSSGNDLAHATEVLARHGLRA